MKTYKVLRQHTGDRDYLAGDTRELREEDARGLVRSGVLVEETKAAAPVKNKAARQVKNKGGAN